mgnify:CR=1 FL=1
MDSAVNAIPRFVVFSFHYQEKHQCACSADNLSSTKKLSNLLINSLMHGIMFPMLVIQELNVQCQGLFIQCQEL